MIKLTAISAEEEPHSTLAGFVVTSDRCAHWIHSGDSRIYWFRGARLVKRSMDHSYVQRLVDEGQLTEAEAKLAPAEQPADGLPGHGAGAVRPVRSVSTAWRLGDSLMCCSDGLWHYFTAQELGSVLHSLPPREAAELLVSKAAPAGPQRRRQPVAGHRQA